MRSFLNDLFGVLRTAKSAAPARQVTRRASLQAELLEDRLVPTTAILNGSILTLNIPQNQAVVLESNGASQRQMEVFDNGTLLKFNQALNISAITAVNITVAGGDNVFIDDSNGMPFAQNIIIKLQGSGNNALYLQGSRAINTGELYVVAGTTIATSTLSLDNLTFQLSSAIASVQDFLQISGQLSIATSGTFVSASSGGFAPPGDVAQTITGLGAGGSGTYTYANKSQILLNEFGTNAEVFLNAPTADTTEFFFAVKMFGAGTNLLSIAATPRNVGTLVQDGTTVVPTNSTIVQLGGSAGLVEIDGNSTTVASLDSESIQANVFVQNVGLLFLGGGPGSTPEKVKVTEDTITGTGLFGNNGVMVSYFQAGKLDLSTGVGPAVFTVAGSSTGARFTCPIEIFDYSTQFLPLLSLTPNTGLDIQLDNLTGKKVDLYFLFANAEVSSSSPSRGLEVIDVAFAGGLTSVVTLDGFNT